jgi:hypothetical protein
MLDFLPCLKGIRAFSVKHFRLYRRSRKLNRRMDCHGAARLAMTDVIIRTENALKTPRQPMRGTGGPASPSMTINSIIGSAVKIPRITPPYPEMRGRNSAPNIFPTHRYTSGNIALIRRKAYIAS